MKKKPARIKKRIWHKLTPFALLASALVAGVIFIQTGSLNQTTKKTPPQIDAISPTVGRGGSLLTITGSGFTTQQEYDTRFRNLNLPPGNYLRMVGSGTQGPPTFSPDGKTLRFQLALDTKDVKNCQTGETSKQCQISLQVVNGEGIPSNVVHFQVYGPSRPLVVSLSLDSQNPPAQNISAGAKDIEVLRFKVKASADNPINVDITYLSVRTLPTRWEIYCKDILSEAKIFDVSTGELVGVHSFIYDDGVIYCAPSVGTWLTVPPGVEKTLSVKLSIAPQAKAGLQFRIAAERAFDGGTVYREGADTSVNTVTSNLITITP